MLIYKQRYKPRTTREFTKSDLTVYDSAGNTALNALTVYGKSEVVDGAIISAGEGYAVVDLGTLTWTYNSTSRIFTSNSVTNSKRYPTLTPVYYICSRYKSIARFINADTNNKCLVLNTEYHGVNTLIVCDTDYTDPTAFKNSLDGVILAYELADPTQGNTIAVKTDDGSGIDGTMATFTTGTPLRGIPDTTVRDVMTWDGSAGEVTNNCAQVDLGALTWIYDTGTAYPRFIAYNLAGAKSTAKLMSPIYTYSPSPVTITGIDKTAYIYSGALYVNNFDYNNATAFKTAMNGVKLVYELATPTTEQLTSTENASMAGLRTFSPQTHAQNNAQTEMTVDYTIRVPVN